MAKRLSTASESDLIELFNTVGEDPHNFDAVLEHWDLIFEHGSDRGQGMFADVENAAVISAASITENVPNSAVGRHVGHLLEQFSSPAFLVRENGRIMAQNTAAVQTFDVGLEHTLDDLPFDLEAGEQIGDAVRSTLDPGRNLSDAILKRAYSTTNGQSVTLSIAPSKPIANGQGEALVFVIDARWKTGAAGLIKREFDLTEAERALLECFLDGQSTQDMATSRNRSHATIRTQFHSLMTKMGARNQTELFRNALSVSQFVDKIGEIANVLRHPYRKRVDLVRPGGRSVEVTMAGDMTGTPVIFIPNGAFYRFEQSIETAFHNAGICALSVCLPGYGDSDPPLPGSSRYGTYANDVGALLDQLGHDSCTIMSNNISSPVMYAMAQHLQDRVAGLIQMGAGAPMPYFEDDVTSVPYFRGVLRAIKKHPGLARFMLKAGIRAWITMGQRRYFNLQLRGNPYALENVNRPEAMREAEHALEKMSAQGTKAFLDDLTLTFSDYNPLVAATDIPLLIIHGDKDPIWPVDVLRLFAADLADRATYVEIAGGLHHPIDTHTAQVIDSILAFQTRIA